MTEETTVITNTEDSSMTAVMERLLKKVDAIYDKLEARPTHAAVDAAIQVKVNAAKLDVAELLNNRATVEQVKEIVDAAVQPLMETVDKLASAVTLMSTYHTQAMQRIEKLSEMAFENNAAMNKQGQDIEALEDIDRNHDLRIAKIKATAENERARLEHLYKTVLPHNGEGGMVAQIQIMAASISKTQDMLTAVEATTEELDKHRARQVRREERFRAFVQSKTGLATAAAVFGPLFGNWLGLVDLNSLGKAIGLAIKLLI